jgi:hypothetical protein
VLGVTNPIVERTPSSMLAFFGSASWVGTGDGTALHIGAKAANGLGLIVGGDRQLNILYGGIALQVTGLFGSAGNWHLVAMTYDGVGSQSVYLDLAAPFVTAGRVPNPSLASDPLVAETPGNFYIAHAAFFSRQLTTAEVQSVFNGATTPLQEGPFGTSAATQNLDLQALAGRLDLILGFVSQTYKNAP